MTNYVLGFFFSDHGRAVALIRKNKPEWQRGKWNGIGGKVETGEHPLCAMRREFQEETGVFVRDWRSFAELRCPEAKVFCYVAHAPPAGMEELRTTTDEKVSVFYLDDLPYEMLPNLKYLIPLALDKDTPYAIFSI